MMQQNRDKVWWPCKFLGMLSNDQHIYNLQFNTCIPAPSISQELGKLRLHIAYAEVLGGEPAVG